MKQTIHQLLVSFLLISICTTNINAQGISFEETWKEFLANNKVTNTSELPHPGNSSIDYPKYCLIYANTSFCGNDVNKAEDFMSKIREFGEKRYSTIPGFRTRFLDLENKMTAYFKTEELWNRFLINHNVTLAELESAKDAVRVCEKGTLAKYTFMEAYVNYCNGKVNKAQDRFENYVLQIVDRTSLEASDVKGLEKEMRVMRKVFAGLKALKPAWRKYVATGVSPGFTIEIPELQCNLVPNMKVALLQGAADVCTIGEDKLEDIEDLIEDNNVPPGEEFNTQFKKYKKEVGAYTGNMAVLNTAWKEFVPNNYLEEPIDFTQEYCDKEAQIKLYIMKGMLDVCGWAKQMLKEIDGVRKEYNPSLDDITTGKITALADALQSKNDDFDTLGIIWTDFIAGEDTIVKEFELQAQYCNLIAQVRSWAVKGHFYYCDQGAHYLKLINRFEKEYNLTYDADMTCAIQRLRRKVWECKRYEISLQAQEKTSSDMTSSAYKKAYKKLLKKADIGKQPEWCDY